MSSGNQQLGFAIRAVNEASAAMREVADDLGFIESAAAGAEPELKDLSQALGQLETDVGDFAQELDAAGGSFRVSREGLDQVAEAAGNLERVLIGSKDILGVLEEQFGVSVGPMVEWSQAAADVAGGVEGIISGGAALVQQIGPMISGLGGVIAATWAHVTALGAQAVAFAVANAPLLLIIGGIAVLAAGILLLIKHWDDIKPHLQPTIDFFNDKVVPAAQAVWEQGLKPVVDFVRDHWPIIASLILLPFAPIILLATDAFGLRTALVGAIQAIVDFIEDAAGWIGHWLNVAGEAFGDFKNMAMGPINAIIEGIQKIIDLAGKIPTPGDIAGKVPGGGIVSKIPGFAEGGVVPGPIGAPMLAVVHGGETVIPVGSGVGGGGLTVVIQGNVYGVDDLIYTIDRALKRGGGSGLVA